MKSFRELTMRQVCMLPMAVAALIAALVCEMWDFVCNHEFPDY